MSNCWSRDEKLFVDAKLEVLWFDLNLANSPMQSLPMERRSGVVYDGPEGEHFTGFLSKMGYRVNHKGRVIVAVLLEDEKVKAFHYFLLDKVVPLVRFGFRNQPCSRSREVMELRSLLEETKAELAKKNDELNESQRQLEGIRKALMKKMVVNLQYGKFSLQDPGDSSSNILEFLRRINGTYVNSTGMYIKLDFAGAKSSGPWVRSDNSLHYYTRNGRLTDPFSLVQFDWNKRPMDIQKRKVILPEIYENGYEIEKRPYFDQLKDCSYYTVALTFKEFCFIGRITDVTGTDDSFENVLVNLFFEQNDYDKEYCYVDALATTFFVLKYKYVYRNEASKAGRPRFI